MLLMQFMELVPSFVTGSEQKCLAKSEFQCTFLTIGVVLSLILTASSLGWHDTLVMRVMCLALDLTRVFMHS